MPVLLGHLLAHAARAPGAPALTGPEGETLDRGTLAGRIAAAAARLRAQGVTPGDRVLLSAANGIDLAVAYFAIHAAGATAVLLPPDTPEAERADVIARTAPRLCLGPAPGALPLDQLDNGMPGDPARIRLPDPAEVADILFTTGTTGRRKGVVLTHAALAAIARNIVTVYAAGPSLVQTVPLPLTHSHGLGTLRALAVGGHALHIARGLLNPRGLVQQMQAVGATGLALVPAAAAFLRRYAGQALAGLAGQLRLVELGSAAIDPELRDWLVTTLPDTRILHHYGMTEASRAVFADYGRDPPGQAGRPAPGVTLTITDEAGEPVPPGVSGEIRVAGEILMAGYWQGEGPPDRARLGRHGFASGDLGRLDADGNLTLLGRLDDVINVGGRKVVPDEVEAALVAADPAVLEAACVPETDAVLGEIVAAHLVLAPGATLDRLAPRLEATLADRLEPHKLPRRWHAADSLPKTASGKLQRARLRR